MDLQVLQDGFRLPAEEMWAMLQFARHHYFTREALRDHDSQHTSLIAIVRTEDEKLWIRDGLHRAAVIQLAERNLMEDEYVIENIPYEKFTEINIAHGWFTPFDLRTEVRKSNFLDFKSTVQKLLAAGINPTEFILAHKQDYCLRRSVSHTLSAYCKSLKQKWRLMGDAEQEVSRLVEHHPAKGEELQQLLAEYKEYLNER